MRLVKHGPFVPAAIFHEFGVWRAEILGETQSNPDPDPLKADKVIFIWHTYRERIDRSEYYRLIGRAADPANPAHRPREAVDISRRQRF